MKKLACLMLAMALPVIAVAQEKKDTPAEPKKDIVITSFRITVKDGHEDAFKAAIASHAQRFHKGDWAWRVGEVVSGPGGNTYQIVEGPFSWTALDGRGDLGAEHMKDYATNVAPHVEKATPDTYATYEEKLSTVGPTEYTNKVIVARYTVKPGKGSLAFDVLKSFKAVSAKRGLSVAVWHTAHSGDNVYALAYRLKGGWKDLDMDLPSMRKILEETVGPNEYGRLQAATAEAFSAITSEMVEYNPELGSK